MSIALIHANIYLLPIIVLFIINQDVKKSLPGNSKTHFFALLVWQIILMMVMETCTWIPEGGTWPGAGEMVWISNILYIMLNAAFSFSWFIYIYSRIPGKGDVADDKKKFILLSIPMLIHWGVMLATPWTHWIFYVNQENRYMRGPLYFIPYLFVSCYMMMAILLAVSQQKQLTRASEKKECILLAVYAAIPMSGLLLQLMDYKFWSAWPFTALAILTIYVSMQNGQITTDGLTGLNNRRQLDKYLMTRCEANDGKLWCLMILDVDDFKSINDQFGHIVGDQVLCRVAEILKKVYGSTDAFLSRFGGDEFAVVLNCGSAEEVQNLKQMFYHALEESNRTLEEPYKLSLSVGCACYDGLEVNDRHSLMTAADEAMYREKQRKKTDRCLPAS